MKNLIGGLDLPQTISGLQYELNLQHWKIETVYDTPPTLQGAMLEIRTIRPRNVARIYFSDSYWKLNKKEQAERLRHELLHLVLDPLWEEYEFQVDHLPENLRESFRKRFIRHLERAVEHLTRMPAVAAEGNLW